MREGLSSRALSVPASALDSLHDTLEQMFDWPVNLL